ncbi:cytochrome b [Ruixingdingia sedimenti]|uniref:Cytochrome b/b6 domain-containing protein n=1 Tax=Ruixingdingia sedimenti TaxID=3073604 RepID=A0ABU1F954_9RHOB|nr:cytochrome b/b6 domain-containing protein [Xinfangfangia sp. LG-4]MDR5653113.1 cytochrome b/b6 domain-containing protein [Xinfangfangia sp. LG-4]
MPHPRTYSRAQIVLHWLVVVLILAQYLNNEPIAEAWRAFRQGQVVEGGPGIALHILPGMLVLLLTLWRLVLRLTRGAPPPPAEEAAPLRFAAAAVHWALYALTLLLPVSGAVAWIGGVEGAGGAHAVMTKLLLALVALHIAAALWHQFWLRDGLLSRMRISR